jgi:hypothetical protein
MVKDSSNTFSKAKLLKLVGGDGVVKETIGGRDRLDFIRFNITKRSSLKATLGKLKGKANLELLDDKGRLLERSTNPGTKSEIIDTTLDSGQYIFKISGRKRPTQYRLTLNTTPLPNTSPTLITNAGINLARGTTTTLGGNLLKATDREQKTLTYTLNQLPVSGKLKLNGTDMVVGQTFTQSDIDNARLSYFNSGEIKALTNNATADDAPLISGSNVIWLNTNGTDNSIYFYNGSVTTQLSSNITSYQYQILGSNAAWVGKNGTDYELYFYNGFTTTKLYSNAEDNIDHKLSNSGVAWVRRGNRVDDELYFYNGSTTTQLTNNAANINKSRRQRITSLKTSGSNIVWTEEDDSGATTQLYLYNGSTITRLVNKAGNNITRRIIGSFQISGSNVVWTEAGFGTDDETYFFNGSTIAQLSNNDINDTDPQISGSNVVWVGRGSTGTDDELYFYNGSTTTKLTNNAANTNAAKQRIRRSSLQISGSNVVWESNGDPGDVGLEGGNGFEGGSGLDNGIPKGGIYFYNGSTITQLTDNAKTPGSEPKISGSNVVWYGRGSSGAENDTGIYFYNGSTTTQLINTSIAGGEFGLEISGSNVVWQRSDGIDSEIYFYNPSQQQDLFGFTVTDGVGGSTSGTFNFTIS